MKDYLDDYKCLWALLYSALALVLSGCTLFSPKRALVAAFPPNSDSHAFTYVLGRNARRIEVEWLNIDSTVKPRLKLSVTNRGRVAVVAKNSQMHYVPIDPGASETLFEGELDLATPPLRIPIRSIPRRTCCEFRLELLEAFSGSAALRVYVYSSPPVL